MKLAFILALLTRFFSGNDVDVHPQLHGPILVLAGGGGDIDTAMQAAIDRVRGCTSCDTKLDVVVLRASGADGYNEWFMNLHGVDSIASIVITDRDSAERDDVVREVENAEVVFFAGGDQCNYVRWIKGTKTARAIEKLYQRGGAIGGTSAGLAIQSDIAYDACPDQSAQSKDVLLDPFSVDVSLSRGFFTWPTMRRTITDTHFSQRERMGRLLVFLARSMTTERKLLGIGVSEATCVLVDGHGNAQIFGNGPVHLVRADKRAEVLERGKPLTLRGFHVWELASGEKFSLKKWPKNGGRTIDVVNGEIQ